jgi:DnaJ-class molecular chaperone
VICRLCAGTGTIYDQPCNVCDATGSVSIEEYIDLEVCDEYRN